MYSSLIESFYLDKSPSSCCGTVEIYFLYKWYHIRQDITTSIGIGSLCIYLMQPKAGETCCQLKGRGHMKLVFTMKNFTLYSACVVFLIITHLFCFLMYTPQVSQSAMHYSTVFDVNFLAIHFPTLIFKKIPFNRH